MSIVTREGKDVDGPLCVKRSARAPRAKPRGTGPQRSAAWSRGQRRKAWGRSRGRVQGAPVSAEVHHSGVGVRRQQSTEDAEETPVRL
eukprot:6049632-Pleurochrysis_carterae.AAC.3